MKNSKMVGPVIALDVGGTAIKGAVVDENGVVLSWHRWLTPTNDGPAAVVDAVLNAAAELQQHAAGALAVGLVVAGLVDDQAGVAMYSENIHWRNVPFRKLVAERTGLPVGFGHDVRAGGMAERSLGAAKGVDDVLFLPIGTGISGAMYVEGRLIENKYAGEIGHFDVGSGELCACGAKGCLESIASGASIARRYNAASGSSVSGAEEVLQLMKSGDQIAKGVWDGAIDALARALATYITLLAPELIVIGGGLSSAGAALLDPLRDRIRRLLIWQQEPRIITSQLADNAACLGAAMLAREALGQIQISQEQ